MNLTSDCFRPDELADMLAGHDTRGEHLAECAHCREALERAAMGESEWLLTQARSTGFLVPSELLDSLEWVGGRVAEKVGDTIAQLETTPDAEIDALLNPGAERRRIGPYEVLGMVGSGGMGIVLQGEDPILRRTVALKIPTAAMRGDPLAKGRFLREARSAARVVHEHVVLIHAVEEYAGVPVLVMAFIQGESLQQKLDREKRLPPALAVRIALETALALEAAHACGLIHRDIKPANILLQSPDDRVRLTDFGLARAADDARLTQTGVGAGTPLFMSPEQARGEAVDARSDLFSLGSVLFTMLAGRPPFASATLMGTLRRLADGSPDSLRQKVPGIPVHLEVLVMDLLQNQPNRRPRSAQVVLARLHESLQNLAEGVDPPAVRHRRRTARLCGLLLAGLLCSFAAAGTVMKFPTAEGTLVVEIDDPATKVSVDGKEVTITGPGFAELKVKLGERKVRMKAPQGQTYDEIVNITRDGKVVVRAMFEDVKPNAFIGGMVGEMGGGRPGASMGGPGMPGGSGMMPGMSGGRSGPIPGMPGMMPGTPGGFSPFGSAAGGGREPGAAPAAMAPGTGRSPGLPGAGPAVAAGGGFNPFAPMAPGATISGGPAVAAPQIAAINPPLPIAAKMVKEFAGHTAAHRGVAVTQDGKTLVTASTWQKPDAVIRVWDVATGKEKFAMTGSKGDIPTLLLLQDDRTVVSGSEDGVVRFWDITTGKQIREIAAQKGLIIGMAISPDGRQLVTGGDDKVMKVHDLTTGRELSANPAFKSRIRTIAISPDGLRIATGDESSEVAVWSMLDGKPLWNDTFKPGWIEKVLFHPKNPDVILVAARGLYIQSLTDPKARIHIHNPSGVTAMAFSPGDRMLATAGPDSTVRIYGGRMRLMAEFQGNKANINGLAWAADGKSLFVSGGGRYDNATATFTAVDFMTRHFRIEGDVLMPPEATRTGVIRLLGDDLRELEPNAQKLFELKADPDLPGLFLPSKPKMEPKIELKKPMGAQLESKLDPIRP